MADWAIVSLVAWTIAAAPPGGKARADSGPKRYEYTQIQMGVSFKIVLYAENERIANRAAAAAYARVKQLNGILSDYDDKSELSRLSDTAGSGQAVKLSPELWLVLDRSQKLSRQTDGAFDVTVGPLVRLWRRARRQRQMPSMERLAEARKAVGYRFVRLDAKNRTATLTKPDMRLDLGGIAKGYAADEALAVLRKIGIRRALVDGSGDIAIGDAPPGKPGWRIGIAPLKAKAPPSQFLTLKNQAVATSGDAWQFVEIDGKRYSHIIDPKTGLGLTDRGSATIVAADCITADSLASAVSVLGPKAGLVLVDKTPKTEAYIVRNADEQPEVHASRGWQGERGASAPR